MLRVFLSSHNVVFKALDEGTSRCRLPVSLLESKRIQVGDIVVFSLFSVHKDVEEDMNVRVACTAWPDTKGDLGEDNVCLDLAVLSCPKHYMVISSLHSKNLCCYIDSTFAYTPCSSVEIDLELSSPPAGLVWQDIHGYPILPSFYIHRTRFMSSESIKRGEIIRIHPRIGVVTSSTLLLPPKKRNGRETVVMSVVGANAKDMDDIDGSQIEIQHDKLGTKMDTLASTGLVDELVSLLIYPGNRQGQVHANVTGVLLCGPPGSGKSKSVWALANHCIQRNIAHVRVLEISLSTILCAYNPIAVLKSIFAEAETVSKHELDTEVTNMTLVLLDEVDALGSHASQCNDIQCGVKLVLGEWMDSLLRRSKHASTFRNPICIVATTNHPEDVDTCLRRGGRLEIEIDVNSTTQSDRTLILFQLIKTGWPLLADGVVRRVANVIAQETGGYLPADLRGLVNVAYNQWREQDRIGDDYGYQFKDNDTTCDEGIEYEIRLQEYLHRARIVAPPSALRGIATFYSHVSFDDIVGQEEAKQALHRVFKTTLNVNKMTICSTNTKSKNDLINNDKSTKEMFSLNSVGGVLLYGPPGNSKSRLVQAAAAHYSLPMILITSADVYSPYVGDAEAAIRRVFRCARQSAPCILFFYINIYVYLSVSLSI
jgi:SpoVK/Ycf46/Vps4 family AAA+-type ATPase